MFSLIQSCGRVLFMCSRSYSSIVILSRFVVLVLPRRRVFVYMDRTHEALGGVPMHMICFPMSPFVIADRLEFAFVFHRGVLCLSGQARSLFCSLRDACCVQARNHDFIASINSYSLCARGTVVFAKLIAASLFVVLLFKCVLH